MDHLRQNLAPISEIAWDEINEQSKRVFATNLSARKFVDVDGPKGWDHPGVGIGRMEVPPKPKDGVEFGFRQFQPMVEMRVPFNLNVWELDDATRGTADIDLSPLEAAAKKLAAFEEKAVYYGLKQALIPGILESVDHEKLALPKSPDDLVAVLTDGIGTLAADGVTGPYCLVVPPSLWKTIYSYVKGYPLKLQVESVLGGPVIVSPHVEGAFLATMRVGDFRLTIGQDIAIGYLYHDKKEVGLYFTETFTFQVLDPAAIIALT